MEFAYEESGQAENIGFQKTVLDGETVKFPQGSKMNEEIRQKSINLCIWTSLKWFNCAVKQVSHSGSH